MSASTSLAAEAARFAANLSILFSSSPLLERPALANDAGFHAVELWWPFASPEPAQPDVDRLVESIAGAGVQLVALNFFAGDMSAGERGVLSDPDRTDGFRASVDVAVQIGARLGCRRFNALYGNRRDITTPEDQDAVARENLAYAVAAVRAIDGVVLLEALSGAPAYPLRTADDVVRVMDGLDEATRPSIAMLADLYHLAVNGEDVDEVIARHGPRIGHVQIADSPGRNEPGSGSLPLARYVRRLRDIGYVGWIGLEYAPRDPSAPDFGWMATESSASVLPEGQ